MLDLLDGALTSSEFERFYRKYKPRFMNVAINYVRDEAVAEDIVSDSFLLYWENRNNLQDGSNIPGYIATTVKNRCLNWLRQQTTHAKAEQKIYSTQQRVLLSGISSLERSNPHHLFENEIIGIIEQRLSLMPEPTRKVFIASRYENKLRKQIAEENNISLRKVDHEINKALNILRVALKDYLPLMLFVRIINDL